MSSDNDLHLDEDQLLKAVVDEADLSQSLQKHLSICHQCRKNKEEIEIDLVQLGQMTERFSPTTQKKVSLPAEKPRGFFGRSRGWQIALGAAAAAIFIGVVGTPTLFKNRPGFNNFNGLQVMLEDEEFITEVSMMAENALPQEYLDITGETDENLDEEFMDFIAPTIEDESWSRDIRRKGGKRC